MTFFDHAFRASAGHKLGLNKAMAGAGTITPAMLADKTNTHESYVGERLNNQTAGYTLPDEHAPQFQQKKRLLQHSG